MKNKKAFTLTEVLIVVIVIILLSSMAIPNYIRVVREGEWADAITAMDVLYKAVMLYHTQTYGAWPPDEPAWFDFYDTDCDGINTYLTTIGSPYQINTRSCRKFDYDIYIGGPDQCVNPANPNCALLVYRKGIGRWTGQAYPGVTKFFGNGSTVYSNNRSCFP